MTDPLRAAPTLHGLRPSAGERYLVLGSGEALLETLRRVGVRAERVDPAEVDRHGLGDREAADAVVCIDALPWVFELDRLLGEIARALVPGGRLLLECDMVSPAGSVARVLRERLARRGIDATRACPWLEQSPESLRAQVEANEFRVESLRATPVAAPADLLAALAIAASTSTSLPPGARPALLHELGHTLRRVLTADSDPRTSGVLRATCLATARRDSPRRPSATSGTANR